MLPSTSRDRQTTLPWAWALGVAALAAAGCLTTRTCSSDADCDHGTCDPTYRFCVTLASDGGGAAADAGNLDGGDWDSGAPDAGGRDGGRNGGADGGADAGCDCANPACQGHVCRPAADGCDVAEVCTGGVCPPDARRDGGAGCPQACGLDQDCGDAGWCGDGGVCAPKKGLGETCLWSAWCGSGSCADGVCCDTPCSGGCDVCNRPGSVGTCVAVDAGLEGYAPSCAPYVCSGASGACPSTCAGTGDCVDGGVCAGRVCQGKRGNGQTCDDAGVCGSGSCADGVCCDSACTGDCQACSASAGAVANGSCAAVAAGTDPKSRCGLYACGGGPACPSTCAATSGCAVGSHCCGSACLPGIGLTDNTACSTATDCASCTCTTFFRDGDGDGYGTAGTTAKFCGNSPPAGWSSVGTDCCDSDSNAHPGQTKYFTSARTTCAGFDYDCDGQDLQEYPNAGGCPAVYSSTPTPCYTCTASPGFLLPAWPPSSPPGCGVTGTLLTACANVSICLNSCNSTTQTTKQPCR